MNNEKRPVRVNIKLILPVLLVIAAVAGTAAVLSVNAPAANKEGLTIHCGQAIPAAADWFTKLSEEAEFAPEPDIDTQIPGEYAVNIAVGKRKYTLPLFIIDVEPPIATPVNVVIASSESVSPHDFYRDLFDHSAVTAVFVNPPDFSVQGIYPVEVLLTDEYGNTLKLQAECEVFHIADVIVLEKGEEREITMQELTSYRDLSRCRFVIPLPEGFYNIVDDHDVVISVDGVQYRVTVSVRKTTPPAATPRDGVLFLGITPDSSSFYEIDPDRAEPTTSEFVAAPDVTRLGTQTVTLRVTDDYGNSVELTATATVVHDTTPPTITGARDFSVISGSTVSYRSGITVSDDYDPNPNWAIDASQVNVNVPGTYPVTHTVTDSTGNMSRVTIQLTVLDMSQSALYQLAETRLQNIGVFNTTDQEEIVRLIHRYVFDNVAYVNSPPYSDDETQLAYNALQTMSGDCLASQRIAEVLLNRAGIENMRIRNTNPNRNHVWNLVKVNGVWYHFDATRFIQHNDRNGSHMFTDSRAVELSELRTSMYGTCYAYDPSLYPAIAP